MKVITASAFKNWKHSAKCKCCKAQVEVTVHDVWYDGWSDGRNRCAGPMFECPECATDNGIKGTHLDMDEFIAPDKRAWQMKSGHVRVPSSAALLRTHHRQSPAQRLLSGCLSILEVKFLQADDIVRVDIIGPEGDDCPARPEFAGCYDEDVVAEVSRRLEDKGWKVTKVRFLDSMPPYRLIIRS